MSGGSGASPAPWRSSGIAATATAGPGPSQGLLDGVRQWLVESGAEPTPARVAQALREQGRVLGDAEVLGAAEQLRSELVGSGPLEPLLADPSVTDVLVTAPDRVWVDRGGGLELTSVSFPDAAAVRRLAQRLAAVAGRRLDDARPWADARLPDGTRLHAVLPPVAVACTCLSLRVVRPRAFTLDEMVAAGTVPPGGDRVLRALLDARLSFLISGGTGCGKTTLLSALLGLVGRGERIVLAEDSAELRPDHPHVVRLETRPANQEGAGLVTLQDLVRQALRMRPDRLVVGEVRGPEVVHLLAALNTGHEGAAAPCMPMPPPTYRPGWRRSARRPGSTGPRCTASWRRRCRWFCISCGTGPGGAGSPRCTSWSGISRGWCGRCLRCGGARRRSRTSGGGSGCGGCFGARAVAGPEAGPGARGSGDGDG